MSKLVSRLKYLIKRVARIDFVKVSFWTTIATIVKMISGFISVKVVAQVIGPAGVAMVGQFANGITLFCNLGTGCIGQGVTKYVAENYDNKDVQQRVIGNALRITAISSLLVTIFVVIFYRQINDRIFPGQHYEELIILTAVSVSLFSFNNLIINIINGLKDFKRLIKANIITSLASLVVSVILVTTWGLYGALLNCIVSQSVLIMITTFFVIREDWFRKMLRRIKLDWKIILRLLSYFIMTIATTLLSPISQITIRSHISNHLSPDAAGHWEAMNRVSSMYLMVFTASITVFYLPRLAELKDRFLLRHEIFKTFKLVIPVLILVCFGTYLFRDIVIRVLFSPAFYSMRDLFAIQMVGDFFKISSILLASLFWAKAMTWQFIIMDVIFLSSAAFLSVVGVNQFGLQGATAGYALNYIIYFITLVVIFRNLLFRR